MATFVLVHGAWHGGWCWKRVRKSLQLHGHDVFAPTLTGLADRSHLTSSSVNLETHVRDIVNLIRWEELSNVILCGHSYGGCVISGVADRVMDRIGALVYLDAFVLEHGESVHAISPFRQSGMQVGLPRRSKVWQVPPIPAEVLNVNPSDRAWVDRQCTEQPLATFYQPIQLSKRLDQPHPVIYILATGWNGSPFLPSYARARARGWTTLTVPCGHDIMLDCPEELTELLLKMVVSSPTPTL